MNLFETIFLDLILITIPILTYLIYLSTNKDISNISKKLYLNLSLITSFFLLYKYGIDTTKILLLIISNSIIILAFLEDSYIFANVFAIIEIFIFYNKFNNIIFLFSIYIIIDLVYIFRNKLKINNMLFTQIFVIVSSIIYVFWIYKYNNIYYDKYKLFEIISCYIIISNILRFIYEAGKNILKTNLTIKELSKEKEIRLSLFKITHEIKNPIAVCKCYLDMLNIHDEKQVEKYVPIINSEIERLLSILQDYLLINKANMDMDIMDLNMLVEETLKKMQPILNEKNIKLNVDLIDDEIFINGDYNRLSQVIINILKNSIESIKNKIGNIEIISKINNGIYYLTIKDNGEGMTKEIITKIREPFFTTKSRGSGLGVSLIYDIVEGHGGKVNYASEYGVGTKVTLEFPLYE